MKPKQYGYSLITQTKLQFRPTSQSSSSFFSNFVCLVLNETTTFSKLFFSALLYSPWVSIWEYDSKIDTIIDIIFKLYRMLVFFFLRKMRVRREKKGTYYILWGWSRIYWKLNLIPKTYITRLNEDKRVLRAQLE